MPTLKILTRKTSSFPASLGRGESPMSAQGIELKCHRGQCRKMIRIELSIHLVDLASSFIYHPFIGREGKQKVIVRNDDDTTNQHPTIEIVMIITSPMHFVGRNV